MKKSKENQKNTYEINVKDELGNDITNTFIDHINKLNTYSPIYSTIYGKKDIKADTDAYFIAYELNLNQQKLIFKWFLIWRIDGLTFNPFTYSENQILCPQILKLYYSLLKDTDNTDQRFKFENVKFELEKINNINEKIKYLIEVTTTFKQKFIQFDSDELYSRHEPTFLKQCELELDKLKQLDQFEIRSDLSQDVISSVNFTNSQNVLIYYYFFKANGLEAPHNVTIASIAKFVHLITGKSFSKLDNSEFYKKLKTAPNFKKDAGLIKDLEIIKPFFQKVELVEIVKMIDNELVIARTERKNKEK